jgi:hypothetical protein
MINFIFTKARIYLNLAKKIWLNFKEYFSYWMEYIHIHKIIPHVSEMFLLIEKYFSLIHRTFFETKPKNSIGQATIKGHFHKCKNAIVFAMC